MDKEGNDIFARAFTYLDRVTNGSETVEGLYRDILRGGLTAYQFWLDSNPFDYGMTIATGLRGRPNPDSQANVAMMRISPLGIFGAR